MDRDLHLLTLMRRQLEEALNLGFEEPRLGYRADPLGLRVRVAGADAVEEVQFGGYCHGEDLVEGAGEHLRRLEEKSYVELTPGGNGTGFVRITATGLEKVRQRQAFEANLRRRLTMPEISLSGGLKVGVMNLWRADWEGHVIRVRNRRCLALGEHAPEATEYLEIDGRLAQIGLRPPPGSALPVPDHVNRPQPWWSKDLHGELRAADGSHEVHAHIGLTAPLRTTGCLISVDGVVVGGDVGKRFVT